MKTFKGLPATSRLLAFLTLALLPIGLLLTALMVLNFRDARRDQVEVAVQDAQAASTALESHIARTILATRLSANAALAEGVTDPCARMSRTLEISPGLTQRFALGDAEGALVCTSKDFPPTARIAAVAPRGTVMAIGDGGSLEIMIGVDSGSVTTIITRDELRRAFLSAEPAARRAFLSDGSATARLIVDENSAAKILPEDGFRRFRQMIASDRLEVIVDEPIERLTLADRISLGLPLIMWILAGIATWYLIHFWVIAPLARLRAAVAAHQPGETFEPPSKLGPTIEVRDLSDSFARTVERIDESDRQMADAIEGQRRLVREVHHRVKNNLQVVASLLSIHGRAAQTPEAKDAYSAIGRRVDALAVVHRNHFAEVEDNRGIALRPMLTELCAGLRATAPEQAKAMQLELSIAPASTTQDAAVATAFFVTEIVEFSMLHGEAKSAVEIDLARDSELTAILSVGSSVLVDPGDSAEWEQFERIVQGLARQLRSPVEKKLGRYQVEIPVFP